VAQYNYLAYFGENHFIQDSKQQGKFVKPSLDYIKFKQHFINTDAFDLTEQKNQEKFPFAYWILAVNLDTHLYPSDLDYLQKEIYKDPIFNLIYPNLQQYHFSRPLAFVHKEFRDTKNLPWSLLQIFCHIIGDCEERLSPNTIQYYDLMYQQAFEQIRQQQKTY